MKYYVRIYEYCADDLKYNRPASKFVKEIEIPAAEFDSFDNEGQVLEHYLHDYAAYLADDVVDKIEDPDYWWDEVRHNREFMRGELISIDGDIEGIIEKS